MSRRPFLLFPMLLLLLGNAGAQPDANEIVRRHLDAIGGKARWQKVESLLLKGTNSVSTFTWVWKRPGMIRTEERDTAYSGKTLITAYDGKLGWISNPFRGPDYGVPRKMDAEELRAWQTGLLIRSDLLDMPAKGAELKLLGREKVGNKPAYKLSLKRPGHDEILLWIDAASYLLVQRARNAKMPWGGEKLFPVQLGDYRNVEGVMIAHSTGETRYVVQVNPAIDDVLFKPPQPLK
ncbi:MAG TPA: hypothetical protein VE974_17325 [Thermoanaerobaculia bacterium]|nr:hypothetical protein [Thermoanaerobaculia bacterium]